MEEAAVLGTYLPLSFRSPKEQEYVAFLWDAFDTNYTHRKYQFAFLAYHMLTMSFVYFNVWQIRQTRPEDFSKALIGFSKNTEKDLLAASSPFSFSVVRERTVLRFLKLIACDNAKIGSYGKLVEDRNNTAHSNGNIFFSTRTALDNKVAQILRHVAEIQNLSRPVIENCYGEFLTRSAKAEEREYDHPSDQIREVLIHGNYMSQRDVDICLEYDVGTLKVRPDFGEIRALHGALASEYSTDTPRRRSASRLGC